MPSKQKPEVVDKLGETTKCIRCGKVYKQQRGFFSPSYSTIYSANNGFLPVCRDCIDTMLRQYSEMYDGDHAKALRRVCECFDMFYSDALYNSARGTKGIAFLMGSYFSRLNNMQYMRSTGEHKNWDDTIAEDELALEIEKAKEITKEEEKKEVIIPEIPESKKNSKSIKVWGDGYSEDDYDFLNNSYSDWKSQVIIDSKSQEMLVKDLCITKLQQNKAIQKGETELYDKMSKLFQKTLDTANLKPIQTDTSGQSGEKTWGTMVEMVEKSEPISDPDPEWEDVDGIVKFITIYFIGHLCKMLKLKNKYSLMYEEEMERYRVTIPELETADEEDVFEYIVNGGDSYDTPNKDT